MKLVRWRRFTWNLANLPTLAPRLAAPYSLRPAHREDLEIIKQVVLNAFTLDTAWSDSFALVRDWIDLHLEQTFERESTPALVIQHGQRIIAASALTTDMNAETHLLTGPCVFMEYHNRGFGTALLYYSLKHLKNCGLEEVNGITKENVAVARFLYPKFASSDLAYDFAPGLAPT